MSRSQAGRSSSIDFESLLKYAVLAPSSHNTQPWRFRIGGKTISLYADRERALPANDPDNRELIISCGCALLNLRVAASHAGFSAEVAILPDSNNDDLLATVDLGKAGTSPASDVELFNRIEARRTYRKAFKSQGLPPSVIGQLSNAATEEHAWFEALGSNESRRQVAMLIAEGDAAQWANVSWRRELAAWMRPRRCGDGLTVPALVAPLARMVVRTFDMGKCVGAKDKRLADESPVLAVLGTEGDDRAHWLDAGQALQRVLLAAQAHGLQASYLNQPIQVAPLRPKLIHILGRDGFPQILLRFGFPVEELPAAPRRSVREVSDLH